MLVTGNHEAYVRSVAPPKRQLLAIGSPVNPPLAADLAAAAALTEGTLQVQNPVS
jgi:hypothetical protein